MARTISRATAQGMALGQETVVVMVRVTGMATTAASLVLVSTPLATAATETGRMEAL